MRVKRIVANIATEQIAEAKRFYQDVLGLEPLMDHGWIVTYGSDERMRSQISFAAEGGSGTPVPDLSIEPWGVRRFFVRDPFGKLVNILVHV